MPWKERCARSGWAARTLCSPAPRWGDWAILASLINSAKLNGLDPFGYMADVLERIVSGAVKANDLDRLLPWAWKAERDTAANDRKAGAA
jgi:hypothetical protein